MKSEELMKEIQQGLLIWYDFKPHCKVLYLGEGNEACADLLKKPTELSAASSEQASGSQICPQSFPDQLVFACPKQTASLEWQQAYAGNFDYIIAIEILEKQDTPKEYLRCWRSLLKPDGTLILGMNNRLGLRYFCGDRDPYTERNFDGIEGYRQVYSKKEDKFRGHCYNRTELEAMLSDSGFVCPRFYSVLPDLRNPSLLYAEDYLPKEDLPGRLFPIYNYPETVFLEEESIYIDLIRSGMFHEMANAYLIECPLRGNTNDVIHVANSMGRGPKHALLTIIHKSGLVEKRAAYAEGKNSLEKIIIHGQELSARGIQILDWKMENGSCTMPYVDAESGQLYLKRLLREDLKMFLLKMDEFRDLILQSSEIIEPDQNDGNGVLLQKGYLDMVPLNSFYINGSFVFYGQEFCKERYPLNAIVCHMIETFYAGDLEAKKLLPIDVLLERYGLMRKMEKWKNLVREFRGESWKEKELRIYHEGHRKNPEIVNTNRQRLNYSETEYTRLFVDVFKNIGTKKLILFGSGNFTKQFLGMYGKKYQVYAVIDNQEEKWGQKIEGIQICPPAILNEMEPDSYKVIICIKNYLSVIKQLNEMHVRGYSIYDTGRAYPREEPVIIKSEASVDRGRKKYHIGYVAGVFDMFHVGHVNLLRRAKEQCDYLIVGVVPDEEVYKQKNKYPIIPCEDRVEVVRSCRYADQVEALPENYAGIRHAYRLFHFDCQFSGDDHGDNTFWQAEREFLEKNGADLVFFPYTEKVSSTQIRESLQDEV